MTQTKTRFAVQSIATEVWCDGTKPCAVCASKPAPEGHWRGVGRVDLHKVLKMVANAALLKAKNLVEFPHGPETEDGYNIYDIAHEIENLSLDEIIAEVTP